MIENLIILGMPESREEELYRLRQEIHLADQIAVIVTAERDALKQERIVAAAIKIDRINLVFSLPQPARHHNVKHTMAEEIEFYDGRRWLEGFLTSTGRFVDRIEGCLIADRAGQLNVVREKTNPTYELFSEDLW